MFPNPPGLLRLEPYSEGLRDRIWWGSAANATAAWAAKLGMNLKTSTLKFDETGDPLHLQQAAQIRSFRAAPHARSSAVATLLSRMSSSQLSSEKTTCELLIPTHQP